MQLLPGNFSCTSNEALELADLLKAADLGSFEVKGIQQLQKFKTDVQSLALCQPSRFALLPPLPHERPTAAAAAAAQPAAATATAGEGESRLLLRQSVEDARTVDLAVLLPDPEWSERLGFRV